MFALVESAFRIIDLGGVVSSEFVASLALALTVLAGSYDEGSRANVELRAALSAATDAARAIRSLARMLERNPNAILTGR